MTSRDPKAVAPAISVIVPARDEVVAIGPLVAEIGRVLAHRPFELIVVDDGSTDGTHHALNALQARHDFLAVIRNDAPRGQSCAIRQGVRRARGAIVVTLDGDGQNPPDQIPLLLAPFDAPRADRLGLVQGERIRRRDTAWRRLASQAANAIRRGLLRDGVRDSGCGMKAFRRAAYLDLPWFDHIHRFMPAMMLREGWDVVVTRVTHRDRLGGASKYSNLARAVVGIPDLLGAAWLIRRRGCGSGRLLGQEQPVEPVCAPKAELRP
ncbi:glycosyltransferase family 2 protein [uncultured Jannaschia sp.]|uniref:glycosyltransferase family 2 protein n=1 Tax=uncultured Jannaschia sp. TaxID=293347 RepID=UPI00262B625C|nr:glycosyltransferase family 2 protein [uncultured Jannaschia sp.]